VNDQSAEIYMSGLWNSHRQHAARPDNVVRSAPTCSLSAV